MSTAEAIRNARAAVRTAKDPLQRAIAEQTLASLLKAQEPWPYNIRGLEGAHLKVLTRRARSLDREGFELSRDFNGVDHATAEKIWLKWSSMEI